MTPQISGALFATEDLQNAVASFLRDGPGKATYAGSLSPVAAPARRRAARAACVDRADR